MPEARDAVRAFLAAATQWRVGPSGHLAGLDYPGAAIAAAGIGLVWKDVFGGVRLIEGEVLRLQAEDPRWN